MADQKVFDVSGRRLMVAIPAYDGKLNIKSAFALANLAVHTAQAGVTLQLNQISGCSLITKARNVLAADFLASDCTDLLFIDADVIFKAEDVMRLLALSGDKDITAGAYPRRSKDKKFFTDLYLTEDGKLEFADGMLRVQRIGTGFMLIRRHVLETLRDKHPEWRCYNNVLERDEHAIFDFQLKGGEYYGEDYTFCNRASEEGFTVHLDTDINLPHVGTEEFANHFGEEVLKPLLEHYEVSNV